MGFADRGRDGTSAHEPALRHRRPERGKGDFAGLVRERQDLLDRMAQLDKRLIGAASDPEQRTSPAEKESWRREMARAEARVRTIDSDLPKDYAALTNPQPLSLEDVQGLLHPNEALLQLVFYNDSGFAWLIAHEGIEWRSLDLSIDKLTEMVRTLRCGLDTNGEWRWVLRWEAVHEHCKALEKGIQRGGGSLPSSSTSRTSST